MALNNSSCYEKHVSALSKLLFLANCVKLRQIYLLLSLNKCENRSQIMLVLNLIGSGLFKPTADMEKTPKGKNANIDI